MYFPINSPPQTEENRIRKVRKQKYYTIAYKNNQPKNKKICRKNYKRITDILQEFIIQDRLFFYC